MKICLMKNMEHDFEAIIEITNDVSTSYWTGELGYIQLTEVVDIELPKLRNEVVIKNQVAIIDRQITKVMADSEASITALNGRKQELLAITYDDK